MSLDQTSGCWLTVSLVSHDYLPEKCNEKMLNLVTNIPLNFNAKACGTGYTSSLLLFVKYVMLVC